MYVNISNSTVIGYGRTLAVLLKIHLFILGVRKSTVLHELQLIKEVGPKRTCIKDKKRYRLNMKTPKRQFNKVTATELLLITKNWLATIANKLVGYWVIKNLYRELIEYRESQTKASWRKSTKNIDKVTKNIN